MAISVDNDKVSATLKVIFDAAALIRDADISGLPGNVDSASSWSTAAQPVPYRGSLGAFTSYAIEVRNDTMTRLESTARAIADQAQRLGGVIDVEQKAQLDALTAEVQAMTAPAGTPDRSEPVPTAPVR